MQHKFDEILNKSLEICGERYENKVSKILLAVSGGADSMSMAELFRRSSVNLDFAVAHCNFHLRGNESLRDENFVESWAKANAIRLHKVDFDTLGFAEEHGISVEMAARDLRYIYFASLCLRFGYDAVAVAHNANDNAETLILNILRGTGGKGLFGMEDVSTFPKQYLESVISNDFDFNEVDYRFDKDSSSTNVSNLDTNASVDDVNLIRPLLSFPRDTIEDFCTVTDIEYKDDSTNAETDFKRNKIRHLVFPIFKQINPSFLKTISREMKYFSQQNAISDSYFETVKPRIVYFESKIARHTVNSLRLGIDVSKLLEVDQWEYVLYRLLEPYQFTSGTLESVEELLKSDRTFSGKRFEGSSHTLLTTSGSILVCRNCKDEEDDAITVLGDGKYELGITRFKVETIDWEEGMSVLPEENQLKFDANKLPFPFVARRWKEGDWMRPLGMRGRKKISDLFVDLKYNIIGKRLSILLAKKQTLDDSSQIEAMANSQVDQLDCSEKKNRVAALLGHRIDDDIKITKDTRKVVVITLID